jgi:hypothetical protein
MIIQHYAHRAFPQQQLLAKDWASYLMAEWLRILIDRDELGREIDP